MTPAFGGQQMSSLSLRRSMSSGSSGWDSIQGIRHGNLSLSKEDLEKLPESHTRSLRQLFEAHAIPMKGSNISFTDDRVESSTGRVIFRTRIKPAESEEIRKRIESACWYIKGTHKPVRFGPTEDKYSTYTRRLKKSIDLESSRYPLSMAESSEKEIADFLLINKPKKIFNEILGCFFVDPEGKMEIGRKWAEKVTFGGGLVLLGVDFVLKQIVLNSATLILGIIGSVFVAVSAAFASISTAHGLYKCFNFEHEMDEFMNNKNLSEEERMKGMLHYLYDKVCISQKEIDQIHGDINAKMPKATDVEKYDEFKKRVLTLAKTKIADLKKMVGDKGAKEIIKQAEAILHQLDKPEKAAQAIKDSQKLYETVKSENTKRKKFYTIMLLGALVTFVVAIVSLALILASLSTGSGGMVLLGISIVSNVLWVLAGIYFVRDMIRHKMNKNDLVPETMEMKELDTSGKVRREEMEKEQVEQAVTDQLRVQLEANEQMRQSAL